MKEEIKEILDKLNEDKDYDDYVDYKGSYFKPLLDYITNLQEEIKFTEDYKDAYETTMIAYKMIEEKYNNYKQRNEKAIEYVERVCESEKNINPYILHAPTLLNILKGDKDE